MHFKPEVTCSAFSLDPLVSVDPVPADNGFPQRAGPQGEGNALQEVEAQGPHHWKVRVRSPSVHPKTQFEYIRP